MRTCVIIDDEKNARDALKKLIKLYFSDNLEVSAMSASVKSGVEAIKKYRPDIVFLDVEMPEKNGFGLFEYFEEESFTVIFTTAYEQYALNAIKHFAFDYLLKPVNHTELSQALNRLEEKENRSETDKNIIFRGGNNVNKIALASGNGYIFENADNIIYCNSRDNYTKVYFAHKKPLLISKTLKNTESILPEKIFFRIHRSYIVNLNYIKKLDKNKGFKITLETGDILPVSKNKIKELTERLKG